MRLALTWAIVGCGAGHGTADSVDEAVRLLTGACRAATSDMTPDAQALALPRLVGPARHAMLTNGVEAVNKGVPWEFTGTGLFVRMEPRED